ncbi:MAG TPA: hypothetical protein VK157_11175 [Phycisphaerales bacterium]|nr:hypothetical protein [Phycisphaerales bacterium]
MTTTSHPASTADITADKTIDAAFGRPMPARRIAPVQWLVLLVTTLCYGAALVASIVMLNRGETLAGFVGIALVLTLLPVAILLLVRWIHGVSRGTSPGSLENVESELQRLVSQAQLSDDAKQVLFRQHERDMLKRAIEDDITNRDWDGAMVLVKRLAERYGSLQLSEEYRQRIERARFETTNQAVINAVAQVETLMAAGQWDAAIAEAQKVQRLFPDVAKVANLDARVASVRLARKQELERSFFLAAQEGKADEAMEWLKQLDQYLTPEEAEPLREMARGVIGKARDNLGAQFKLALQDKQWRKAAEIGEQIIAQFPNSRMAGEVRDIIDGIRQRAAAME